jgi:hypothetical protein
MSRCRISGRVWVLTLLHDATYRSPTFACSAQLEYSLREVVQSKMYETPFGILRCVGSQLVRDQVLFKNIQCI